MHKQMTNSRIEENSILTKASLFCKNVYFVTKNSGLIYRPRFSDKIRNEYARLAEKIRDTSRKLNSDIPYADNYNIMPNSGLLIYDTIIRKKPKIVLETGVANGFSTMIILSALNRNGKGKLYSTEVSRNVGTLLGDSDKRRWILRVGTPRKVLSDVLDGLENIDVFLHDSDHSYRNMIFEFDAVDKKLSKSAIVMSDDIDTNQAFMEFARRKEATPKILPTVNRTFGFFELE